MTNRRNLIILSALALLILSACQPQIELEPAQEEGEMSEETAVPGSTPSLEAIIETPILEAVTATASPELIEELVMPVEPTSQRADPTTEESVETEEIVEASRPAPPTAVQPDLNHPITQAKDDLALRQALPVEEIELLSYEDKVWPDSSLGCPQPGWNYLQVLTEGYQIRLGMGDKVYHYHGGGNRGPFLCKVTGPEKEITREVPLDVKLTPTKSVPPPKK